jgi:hypothetical protein
VVGDYRASVPRRRDGRSARRNRRARRP